MARSLLMVATLAALAGCNGPSPHAGGPDARCGGGAMHLPQGSCAGSQGGRQDGSITISGTARIGVVISE